MVMFRTRNARLPIELPDIVTTVTPDNDDNITYSDLAGTWTTDATRARPRRPVIDGQGFDYATPAARASISVTALVTSAVVITVQYTGLVTRNDTYKDVGSVLVNGDEVVQFTCPVPHGLVHPTASKQVIVPVTPGTSIISLIWPYCASLDLTSFGLPAGVLLNDAPVRTSKKLVGYGDSRQHGFSATKSTQTMLYKAALLWDAQCLNLSYGGRQIVPSDATAAGTFGADGAVALAGYNMFYPMSYPTLAQIQEIYEDYLTNFRASSAGAGKPNARLVALTELWANADIGEGPYAANVPTHPDYRTALIAAEASIGDADTVLLSGNTGGMPTGYGSFPDGVHATDTAQETIAGLIVAQLP
jgi:hypothetical protein